MRTVAVVDYGMGNLRSVSQAVLHAAQVSGLQAVITSSPEAVRAAERIVLPGQGAMPDCMRELRESGLLASVPRLDEPRGRAALLDAEPRHERIQARSPSPRPPPHEGQSPGFSPISPRQFASRII